MQALRSRMFASSVALTLTQHIGFGLESDSFQASLISILELLGAAYTRKCASALNMQIQHIRLHER